MIIKYGECFLVQDEVPSHNAWQQTELLEIPGLTVIPWPGNSPDLNQIEPCWYHLKRTVSKRPFRPTTKQSTIEAWDEEWERLDMIKVRGWCEKMCEKMQRVLDHDGNNDFHG